MAEVEFPESLFERIRTGNCILCTGVRFAATAGMPTWDILFDQMSSKLGADDGTLARLLAEGKLLTVAGYLKRKLGSDSCIQILREAFSNRASSLPESHQALKEIPFRAALSTGYDTLVEEAIGQNGRGVPKVYTYADGAILRLTDDLQHYVVKAHGDVAHPAPMVLDRLDYKRVIGPNQAYRAFVEDLYRTRTLLIMGYHSSDPDFVLLLERLLATFREAVTDHYAVLPGLTLPEQEELYANYRIRVIPFDEGDRPGDALTTMVSRLRDRWKERGAAFVGDEAPGQRIQWLRQQLAPVEVRLDVLAAEGLELSDARLESIRQGAATVSLADLDEETLCRLGNVSISTGDVVHAIQCFTIALEKNPEMAEAHLNLHHAAAEARKFDEALEHLRLATTLDPGLRSIPERYELTRVIGRGTTGTIYQARDRETARDVVVKVLRASYVREHVSPQRWLKETEALKGLTHPNLAQVHDALIEHGRCVLVTESLSGRSLSALVREEGHVTPDRAAQILGGVCQGLEYAHEKQIFHLDITPSNIFLRDDGSVALMDFRTGRAQKGRYVTERESEGFRAPELVAGAGGDVRSDVYSLGAVLYFAVTGKVPLGSFPRLAEANTHARRFDPLITRSLRALPDERPPTVGDFAKALAASSEEVTLPEREDDLDGWLEVLAYRPDHEKAHRVLVELEKTYRAEKNWDSLVALLLGRVEFEAEVEIREHLLREVAQIFEREVGDLGKAFAALQAAFRDNSSSVEIRKELERLAGATGLWNELLQEYTQQVQQLREPKLACDWWVRIGHLYSNELGYDDYALAALNQALALDGNRVDALAEQAEVLKRKGLLKDYTRTLSRLADLESSAARRVELLKELARTHLKDSSGDAEAIIAYRRILEIEAGHVEAISALEGLYQKAEMWAELAGLLRGRIEVTEVADDLRTFRRSLAEVLSDKLKQPEAAIAEYQKLLEADPDDVPALKALERLYDLTGRNEDYLRILEKRISSASTVEEKVALCRRMATEWEAQEGGKTKAAEYLEKIVGLKGGDEETYKGLVRLYWAIGDHLKLADAYQRHLKLIQEPLDRAGLYAALGKVYEEHLKDIPKAIEAFSNLLAVDDNSKIALSALGRLYQLTGVWGQAVQTLQRLATKEEQVEKQVEVFYRLGVIQTENLRRDEDAEISLIKALELKDNHVESLLAIGELYRRRKDFGKAGRMFREAAHHTANELEKLKRLFTAALIYHDDLADEAKAIEVYEEMMSLDPEHVSAGERLAALYEKRAAEEQAVRVLEMLVRKTDFRDRGRMVELNLRLGKVAIAAGKEDRAMTALRAAYDLDPTHDLVLRQLADLLHQRGELEEAGKLFQTLLVHRRDSMSTADIVDVFQKLGEIKEHQGEQAKALNMYEKALDVDPAASRVLERAIHLYEEKEDFESVLRCMKNLMKIATDEEERLQVAEEIGDLLHEKIKRGAEAIAYYKMVTDAKPDLRRVLNKIMEIYVEQKRWEEAVTVMGKIEDYETDPGHRARLHYTAAVIFRDEMRRLDDAAWHFDQALVKDPTHRKAFDALKVLYTRQQNWKGLVKAYRLMLQRLPDSTPVEEQVQLWHELGQICQDKLQDIKGAIVAFEVAAKLDPLDESRQDNLALLYTSAGPDAYDKAIIAHQRLLKNNPYRLETYQDMRRLYGEMKQKDREWCVAAVLCLLKKAQNEEKALYQKYRSATPRRVSRKLSDDLWREHLWHPRQSRVLNHVFSSVASVIAPMAAKPAKSYGLRPAERLEHSEDKRPYARMASYVSRVLDQTVSEMYVRGEARALVSMVLVGSPEERAKVLLLAPALVSNESESELAYWFTRAFALLRPEHVLYFATPSVTVLHAVALAALKLVQPDVRLSGDVEEVLRITEALRADLPPAQVDGLAERAKDLRLALGEGQVAVWMKGVSLSISRAALLLSDDLETAARLMTAEPEEGIDPKDRLKELLLFSVSESYFKLREMTGLKIS